MLDGGAGADALRGGAGNDTYAVDNSADVVDETGNGGAGTDAVRSSATFTLAAGVENLTLIGAAAINGTGNASVNTLDAAQNSAANTLKGLGGGDFYIIGAGDTVDESAAGSDGIDGVQSATTSINFGDVVHFKGALENITLTGSAALSATGNALTNVIYASTNSGANLLRGLAGNDIYVVGAGDVVDETGSDGIDTVYSAAITVNFGDAVHFKGTLENITLSGGAAISAAGNALANIIDGEANTGANLLRGLAGNDIYTVGSGDTVDESVAGSDGIDTVRSLTIAINLNDAVHYKGVLENILLLGSTALGATGNAGANTITGNAGANIIDGGLGKDTMTGAAAADIFRFSAVSHSGLGADADIVTDFDDSGDDRIDLAAVYGATLTYQGAGAITGLGQVNVTASGADVFVHVNVAGTVASDMDIRFVNTTLASMAASDFVL
jgi:Ca2+-binding RTX toxin-like protein